MKNKINIDPDFLKLVKGKKVALIGPSPHLMNKDIGSYIDTYDLVCRVNNLIPLEEMRKDYGSRVDIYVDSFATPWIYETYDAINKNIDFFEQLKFVVCPVIKSQHSETDYLQWDNNRTSPVVDNFNLINRFGLPFYWVGVQDYKSLYSRIGHEPNSGMLSAMLLLESQVEELFVTGFSFYLGGNTKESVYCPGHLYPSFLQDNKRAWGVNSGHGYAANIAQINYFKSLCAQFGNTIKIDSHMEQILEFTHSNIYQLNK